MSLTISFNEAEAEALDVIAVSVMKDTFALYMEGQCSEHPEDREHAIGYLRALGIVIRDFMTPDEYTKWLGEVKNKLHIEVYEYLLRLVEY